MTTASRVPAGRTGLDEQLELQIRSGALKPGDKLPSERQLVTDYGVSRSVVREILGRLEERGLIESAPGRGSFVREPDVGAAQRSMDTILRRSAPTPHHVVQARLTLEAQTSRLAAEHADDDDVRAMEEALIAFDSAKDVVDRARADVMFHAAIAAASHNPVYEFMFSSISTMAFEIMIRSLSDADVATEAVPLHRAVLDAIRAGDGDAASRHMVEHLEVALNKYGPDLDERLDLLTQRRTQLLLAADQ